mmetsp:Transcript_44972/g.106810  ORF Transcript_44972/g.106810 Transcript_44972/m.106810 type:complete len:122 (-) Transcript_44972:19-384(-)
MQFAAQLAGSEGGKGEHMVVRPLTCLAGGREDTVQQPQLQGDTPTVNAHCATNTMNKRGLRNSGVILQGLTLKCKVLLALSISRYAAANCVTSVIQIHPECQECSTSMHGPSHAEGHMTSA